MSTLALPPEKVIYPECDGEPMADNTVQFRWIVTIQGGLDGVFRDDDLVFVAGNLLWYAVEGDPEECVAPDVFAAFGRPKGDRGSYMQWVEGNVAPQVTFEIFSPGNRAGKLTRKFKFYEKHGVEEYYLYDPEKGVVKGWLRTGGKLKPIKQMNGWVSPRLKVRFEVVDGELRLYGPDGKRFATYVELIEQRELALQEQEKERLAKEEERAEKEKERAEKEKERQAKEVERAEKEKERERANRLAAQLKALGIRPEA